MAKILVADDDPDILELLKFTLESEQHQVVLATNGEEAYRKALFEKPDVVVLDVMMPKMTGYETCEKIRADASLSDILIVMLTAKGQVKDKITGLKLGADDYMPKPFEPHELVARIEGLMARKERQGQRRSQAPAGEIQKMSLEEELKARLDGPNKGSEFAMGILDINGFKQFNDKFGPLHGDKFLESWKAVLQGILTEQASGSLFHQGGDDFVMLFPPSAIDSLSAKILQEFEKLAASVYSQNPPTLALGILKVTPSHFSHHSQILDRLKDFLKLAKSQPGHHVIKGA